MPAPDTRRASISTVSLMLTTAGLLIPLIGLAVLVLSTRNTIPRAFRPAPPGPPPISYLVAVERIDDLSIGDDLLVLSLLRPPPDGAPQLESLADAGSERQRRLAQRAMSYVADPDSAIQLHLVPTPQEAGGPDVRTWPVRLGMGGPPAIALRPTGWTLSDLRLWVSRGVTSGNLTVGLAPASGGDAAFTRWVRAHDGRQLAFVLLGTVHGVFTVNAPAEPRARLSGLGIEVGLTFEQLDLLRRRVQPSAEGP